MKHNAVKELAVTGISIALVFVATLMINIRLPIGYGGLIHLGNVPLFLTAIIYGKKTGAIAGAVGMGLFDLIGGWTPWAPATFLNAGLIGYTMGVITERKPTFFGYVLAMVVACIIKVVGYYIAEALIYGNWVQPIFSIPGDVIQVVVAAVVVLPIAGTLKKSLHRRD